MTGRPAAVRPRGLASAAILLAWCLAQPATARAQDSALGTQSSEQLRSDTEQIDALLASIDGGGTYIVDPRMGLDPDPQAGESVLVLPVATDDLEKTLLAMLIESESPGEYDDYLEEVQRRTQSVRSELLAWRSRYEAELARRGEAAPDRGQADDAEYADTRPPCGFTSDFGNQLEIRPGVMIDCRPDDEPPDDQLSSNPTATFRPRDHIELPDVEWDREALTLKERCTLAALIAYEGDAEASRLTEEVTQIETRLEEIDEKLKPLDEQAASDPAVSTLRTAIRAADALGKVPEKYRSLTNPERVGTLEDVVRQADVLCREQGVMDALAVGAELQGRGGEVRNLEWICGYLPPSAVLSGMSRRAMQREPLYKAQLELQPQHEENTRRLKSIIEGAEAAGRTAYVLGCED